MSSEGGQTIRGFLSRHSRVARALPRLNRHGAHRVLAGLFPLHFPEYKFASAPGVCIGSGMARSEKRGSGGDDKKAKPGKADEPDMSAVTAADIEHLSALQL